MKESRRAKRMQRHHKRNKRGATLNMISLMDIFTILVFFLMVTASESDPLPTLKDVKLPESTAQKIPKENIIVIVSDKQILLQGKAVVNTSRVMRSKAPIILELQYELDKIVAEMKKHGVDAKALQKRGITVMGDRKIPFKLLEKIMLTCGNTEFGNISLAVIQKAEEQEQ